MGTPTQFVCKLSGNAISIGGGGLLQASPIPEKLGVPPEANADPSQLWEIVPESAGSTKCFIRNQKTSQCVDIQANSIARGTPLDVWPEKATHNQNQLWQFLPDPFGSPYFFIQNPETGFVVEIAAGSTDPGAPLVVSERKLFDNNHQLWAFTAGADTPVLTLSPTGGTLFDSWQYVFHAKTQEPLTNVSVTIDIISDLVVLANRNPPGFSVQINGFPPYPGPETGWPVLWEQYWLQYSNNTLSVASELWPPKPTPKNSPYPGEPNSAPIVSFPNGTIPEGTKITLKLPTNGNKCITEITGEVHDGAGNQLGILQKAKLVGSSTYNHPAITDEDLAPLGSFQVVIVGQPGGEHANFRSGMGIITVACDQALTLRMGFPFPGGAWEGNDGNPSETSNCYYGMLDTSYRKAFMQPFGLPRPRITNISGDFEISGAGFYPNSDLTLEYNVASGNTLQNFSGTYPGDLSSESDGTFSCGLELQDPPIPGPEAELGTLVVIATDAQENSATASIGFGGVDMNKFTVGESILGHES
jgi:hypothetical protein